MRRGMFAAGCFGIGAATAGFLAATLRFLVPNVLYEPSRRFDIGPPSDFAPGSVTFLPDRQLYVFNERRRLLLPSRRCARTWAAT